MMMMMIMMIAIIVIIMETPKIAQHVPERVRVFGCVEAGQPTIAADSNSGQKHVAFVLKFQQSASVPSQAQYLSDRFQSCTPTRQIRSSSDTRIFVTPRVNIIIIIKSCR